MKKKFKTQKYFIWTNDYENFEQLSNKLIIKKYYLINENVINDFDLFQYSKTFYCVIAIILRSSAPESAATVAKPDLKL